MNRPEIDKKLMAAQKRHEQVKNYYSRVKSFSARYHNIHDIGGSDEIDPIEAKLVNRIITKAHQQSMKLGEYTKYAPSCGTDDIKAAVAEYFKRWGVPGINPENEVMITRGVIDGVRKIVEALDISHVLIPSFGPYYTEIFALLAGRKVIPFSQDLDTGHINLSALLEKLKSQYAPRGKILMYLSQPLTPSGAVIPDEYIRDILIPFLQENGIWLVSDSYISATRFDGQATVRPILSFNGTKEFTVEMITVSKEIGLPGARCSGIAGNADIIKALQVQAITTIDMIALPSQRLVTLALNEIDPAIFGKRVSKEMHDDILPRLEALNWPYKKPQAGINMMIAVPNREKFIGQKSVSWACSMAILRSHGIAFFPCSLFSNGYEGDAGRYYLRVMLKQKKGEIAHALDILREQDFDWRTFDPGMFEVGKVLKKRT